MDSKKAWQSKTLWVNLLMAVAAFIPQVQVAIAGNPEAAGLIVTVVNAGLRMITKGKIEIK